MTDELGTGNRDVPDNLFDLDELRSLEALPTGTTKRPTRTRASERPAPDADEANATLRPLRRPTTGTGPALLLTVEEAARSLSIGRSKAYELIAAGDLEAVHIGRSTRVPVSALQDLLDRLPRAAEG